MSLSNLSSRVRKAEKALMSVEEALAWVDQQNPAAGEALRHEIDRLSRQGGNGMTAGQLVAEIMDQIEAGADPGRLPNEQSRDPRL